MVDGREPSGWIDLLGSVGYANTFERVAEGGVVSPPS
jgi:hypothetical protein